MPKDIVDKQKRRSQTRQNLVLLAALVVVTGLIFAYLEKDRLIAKLSGIQTAHNGITQNDGTLAQGNFPLRITSGAGYDMEIVDDNMVLLHDAYLDLYSLSGASKDSRQHTFQNAFLTTSDRYMLTCERGAAAFRLDTKKKNCYTKTAENNIITSAVGTDGTAVLVTESDAFSSEILAYDETGRRIYKRSCTEYVAGITMLPENNGCIYTAIDARGAEISSQLIAIDFHQEEILWQSEPLNTLILSAQVLEDQSVCVVGTTACGYFSPEGKLTSRYDYPDTLLDAAQENGRIALLLRNEMNQQITLTIFDQDTAHITQVQAPQNAYAIQAAQGDILVMSKEKITAYGTDAQPTATVALDGSYRSFRRRDGYLYLLGYDRIDRVDFKE